MWFRRVLFPQPLPPMMTKIWPRSTVKVRSRWMTKLPYAMVRSWTVMRGTGAGGLDVEGIEDDREEAVEDDEEDDGGDHRGGGGEPDRGRAPPGLHAAEAAGEGHHHPEHHALADPDGEVGDIDRGPRLLEVLGGAEPEHADP